MTTARPTTTPPPAAIPSTSRATTSTGPLGATAHTAEKTVKVTAHASSSPRRPRASLTGPSRNCPAASPAMNAVRVSWVTVALVPSDCCIEGRPEM